MKCDLCNCAVDDLGAVVFAGVLVRDDSVVSGLHRPLRGCRACVRTTDQATAAARFGAALKTTDVFGPDQTPTWERSWLGLAFGVTPALFVPCTDGTVQRVRVCEDAGQSDAVAVRAYRDALEWISTHDIYGLAKARRAQTMAAKALHDGVFVIPTVKS